MGMNSKERAIKAKQALKARIEERNAYEKRMIVQHEAEYCNAMSNGRYFLERCNMLAKQIDFLHKLEQWEKEPEKHNMPVGQEIEEIDGVQKSKELLIAEYGRTKMTASQQYRKAYFAKLELNKLKITDEEIDGMYQDHVGGAIVRDSYDEIYAGYKGHKAEFVKE